MTKLEFFESIDQFPLERFNAFNKYVMLDSELGNTIQDFDKNVVRINEFITKDMIEEAKNELQNLRFVVSNILSENDTKGLAYASTIKKVDGVPLDDYSEDKLRVLLKKLSDEGLTIKEVVEHNTEVKKK
jgi:hypothetical protein